VTGVLQRSRIEQEQAELLMPLDGFASEPG